MAINNILYVHVVEYEPWWMRWFGRLHWLMHGLEIRNLGRWRKREDRINITIKSSLMWPGELHQLTEKMLPELAAKMGYREMNGDLISPSGSQEGFWWQAPSSSNTA